MTLELNRPTIDVKAESTLRDRIPREGRPTWLGFALNSVVAASSMTAEFLTGDMGPPTLAPSSSSPGSSQEVRSGSHFFVHTWFGHTA